MEIGVLGIAAADHHIVLVGYRRLVDRAGKRDELPVRLARHSPPQTQWRASSAACSSATFAPSGACVRAPTGVTVVPFARISPDLDAVRRSVKAGGYRVQNPTQWRRGAPRVLTDMSACSILFQHDIYQNDMH